MNLNAWQRLGKYLPLILGVGPLWAMTYEGLNGLPGIPSAHTLGSGQLRLGFSGSGHQDGDMVRKQTFLADSPGGGSADTLVISELQSFTLRFGAALGLGDHIDMGFSLPLHGDVTSDTRAKDLTGVGLGDPEVFFKLGLGGAEPKVIDIAMLGSWHWSSNSKPGFLTKDPGYAGHDRSIPARRFFSAGHPWGETSLLASLDLRTLPYPLPFALHVGSGYRLFTGANAQSGWQSQAAMEWQANEQLGFFFGGHTLTRIDWIKSPADLGADYATLSAGMTLKSPEGFLLDVAMQKGMGHSPYYPAEASVGEDTYRYETKNQPNWQLTVQFGWSLGVF